jgi:hypothetical protein
MRLQLLKYPILIYYLLIILQNSKEVVSCVKETKHGAMEEFNQYVLYQELNKQSEVCSKKRKILN